MESFQITLSKIVYLAMTIPSSELIIDELKKTQQHF